MNVVVENKLDYSLMYFRQEMGREAQLLIGSWNQEKLQRQVRSMQDEFLYLLFGVQSCNDMAEVRRFVQDLSLTHFTWGFGGNHFWVKQRGGKLVYPDRLLFVDFTK